ncbi:MAG: sensor histidine kinase [Dehalococcoidia bacterium]
MTSWFKVPTALTTLRTRITAWYMLLVTLTLLSLSIYLYFRLESSLISQVDAALIAASAQATANLEDDDGQLVFDDHDVEFVGVIETVSDAQFSLQDGPTFQLTDETEMLITLEEGLLVQVDALPSEDTPDLLIAMEIEPELGGPKPAGLNPVLPEPFSQGDLVVRAMGSDGTVWDTLGDSTMAPFSFPLEQGFVTGVGQDGKTWRIRSEVLASASGEDIGWVQTARSLESVEITLDSVRTQLYWGIPVAILIAGLGGLFLADQGLRPIGRISRTAQEITGSVLNRRINHRGPDDEVGRLARTLDEMLDRLEGAFKRERRFTSDASHELRTPLAALKGRIDVTLSSPRTQGEYESTLEGLEGEVDRLIRLSNELLFLARLDQGQLQWQPEEVDLRNLLGAVLDQIRPIADTKGLTIEEDVPKNLVVNSDPDHLIRLFLNLVDNACQYTPSGGRVSVAARRSAEELRVSISDTGPGISEEHVSHLFERFYRVDPSRSRDSGGTGLGLSIAYEISQLSKGNIKVASKVGAGTTFTVVLPATAEAVTLPGQPQLV